MINIDFYYFEDCPSHDEALRRVHQIVDEEGIQAQITVTSVATNEAAEAYQFTGSPTIRVNGTDIVPPNTDDYSLACRVYVLEDGRYSPLPSLAMIRRAVRAAAPANTSSTTES